MNFFCQTHFYLSISNNNNVYAFIEKLFAIKRYIPKNQLIHTFNKLQFEILSHLLEDYLQY